MKAASKFSFDGKVYEEGDAVNITDPTALEKLKERGHVSEGKGTEQKTEFEKMQANAEVMFAPHSTSGTTSEDRAMAFKPSPNVSTQDDTKKVTSMRDETVTRFSTEKVQKGSNAKNLKGGRR